MTTSHPPGAAVGRLILAMGPHGPEPVRWDAGAARLFGTRAGTAEARKDIAAAVAACGLLDRLVRPSSGEAGSVEDLEIEVPHAGTRRVRASVERRTRTIALTLTDISDLHDRVREVSVSIDALGHRRAALEDFAACATDWFWTTDADCRITHVRAPAGACKVDVAACLVGRTWLDAIDRDAGDATHLAWALKSRVSFKLLHLHSTPDGNAGTQDGIWLRVTGRPYHAADGAFLGFRGAASDVTMFRRQGRALAEAQRLGEMLTAAVQASPVNLTIADATRPDRPLLFVNDSFCATTGFDKVEVIGRNCSFLQGPETDEAEVARMRRALDAGTAIRTEILNYRRDGTPFWNQLDLAPVKDADGRVTAFVGVQHDTTAERRASEQERHRQKMESLGRLAGGVAHEINNLLQPALSMPELVADYLSDDAEDAREMLQVISDHAREARRVASDILTFGRSDEGTDTVAIHDPREAVRVALEFVVGVTPATIEVATGGLLDASAAARPLPSVQLELGELKQVLTNLLTNAAYAMEGRGRIDVRLDHGVSGVILSVRDRGCGMDPETLQRAFEPFYTTKPVGQGTGLGLSLVYGIVTRWGGSIDCDSAPGAGTTVSVTLPFAGLQPNADIGDAGSASPQRSAAE